MAEDINLLPFLMTELGHVPGRNPRARETAQAIIDATYDNIDIHALLVLALAYIESSYRPAALSPVGARGLMQIMPATARELARRPGAPPYKGPDDLYDPVINVKLGIPYMLDLRREFGQWPAALTAYNRGPGNTHKIIQRHNGVIPPQFLVPYSDLVLRKYLSLIRQYPGSASLRIA